MRKGDMDIETIMKLVLALLLIAIIFAFYQGYVNDIFKWGCNFANGLLRKIPGMEGASDVCIS